MKSVTDHEKKRKSIYNKYPRGWVQTKMLELGSFSVETGYDWNCIRSADCKSWFGPEGHERCQNCLGMIQIFPNESN